jgi:hypothetical protein
MKDSSRQGNTRQKYKTTTKALPLANLNRDETKARVTESRIRSEIKERDIIEKHEFVEQAFGSRHTW